MKIYLASSWRNKKAVNWLGEIIRAMDIECDDFTDPKDGRFVFSWTEILTPKGPEFEGVTCSCVEILCEGYYDEQHCGLWEPRNPGKGRYTWSSADNANPFKGNHGPVTILEDKKREAEWACKKRELIESYE